MASLKDVKMKIGGVKKTKQITKAMHMVASAKLRGAQLRIENFRPYANKFQEVLSDIAQRAGNLAHVLLQEREVKTALIILVTSDRGLCGGFNIMLIAKALDHYRKFKAAGVEVKFICIGKKGRDAIRKLGVPMLAAYVDVLASFDFNLALDLGKNVLSQFTTQQVDQVDLISGEFISVARQQARLQTVLPIKPTALQVTQEAETKRGKINQVAPAGTEDQASQSSQDLAGQEQSGQVRASQVQASQAAKPTVAGFEQEYIYEPDAPLLLASLLPRFVNVQIYRGLLDTAASENAARMSAMNNATRNCDEMVEALTRLYNKTRQTAITNELIDIVGGAEALQ